MTTTAKFVCAVALLAIAQVATAQDWGAKGPEGTVNGPMGPSGDWGDKGPEGTVNGGMGPDTTPAHTCSNVVTLSAGNISFLAVPNEFLGVSMGMRKNTPNFPNRTTVDETYCSMVNAAKDGMYDSTNAVGGSTDCANETLVSWAGLKLNFGTNKVLGFQCNGNGSAFTLQQNLATGRFTCSLWTRTGSEEQAYIAASWGASVTDSTAVPCPTAIAPVDTFPVDAPEELAGSALRKIYSGAEMDPAKWTCK